VDKNHQDEISASLSRRKIIPSPGAEKAELFPYRPRPAMRQRIWPLFLSATMH
jgi:hypothetical protein